MNLLLRERLLRTLVTCRKNVFPDIKLTPEQLYGVLNANYTNDELAELVVYFYENKKIRMPGENVTE
jgi:hypothetical protein